MAFQSQLSTIKREKLLIFVKSHWLSKACGSSGTWCRKLLLMAALWQSLMVGWSGMVCSQASKLSLNLSWWPEAMSLSPLGHMLKRAAPLTAREPFLAFLTLAGADLLIGFGVADQPLLGLYIKSILYPLTIFIDIFHTNIMRYLSLLLSWLYIPNWDYLRLSLAYS